MRTRFAPLTGMLACSAFMIPMALAPSAHAATIVHGDVTTVLGPDFFVDEAALGGGDVTINQPSSLTLTRNFGTLNVGAGGSLISITGIGWATPNAQAVNDASTVAVTITYLGLDGVFGGLDDVVIGSASGSYAAPAAAGEVIFAFDSAISNTIDGTNSQFRIVVTPSNGTSNGSIRFKTLAANPNPAVSSTKISVAGTSTAVNIPEPSSLALLGLGGLLIARRRRNG